MGGVMEPLKRRAFFSSLFGGAAATAVAIQPAKSEVKDLDGGKMALAELKPDKEYLLFADPTRVDLDALADSYMQPGMSLPRAVNESGEWGLPFSVIGNSFPTIRVVPTIARAGMPVSDNVALYALDTNPPSQFQVNSMRRLAVLLESYPFPPDVELMRASDGRATFESRDSTGRVESKVLFRLRSGKGIYTANLRVTETDEEIRQTIAEAVRKVRA
jgi:hypothetical protein